MVASTSKWRKSGMRLMIRYLLCEDDSTTKYPDETASDSGEDGQKINIPVA